MMVVDQDHVIYGGKEEIEDVLYKECCSNARAWYFYIHTYIFNPISLIPSKVTMFVTKELFHEMCPKRGSHPKISSILNSKLF